MGRSGYDITGLGPRPKPVMGPPRPPPKAGSMGPPPKPQPKQPKK
jgi:hypothetical protein